MTPRRGVGREAGSALPTFSSPSRRRGNEGEGVLAARKRPQPRSEKAVHNKWRKAAKIAKRNAHSPREGVNSPLNPTLLWRRGAR